VSFNIKAKSIPAPPLHVGCRSHLTPVTVRKTKRRGKPRDQMNDAEKAAQDLAIYRSQERVEKKRKAREEAERMIAEQKAEDEARAGAMSTEHLISAAPELRFAEAEAGVISGYAAVWGQPDSFGDVLVRGAFASSLEHHRAAGTRPLMLWSHNPAAPIGVWDNVAEDAKGLKVEGRLVLDATAGRDARALLQARALDGLSIGFRTVKATPTRGGRRVEDVDLIEVSLVARPAQPAARVTSIRSESQAAGIVAAINAAAARLKR
jgi:HK97 family phage prohead protease